MSRVTCLMRRRLVRQPTACLPIDVRGLSIMRCTVRQPAACMPFVVRGLCTTRKHAAKDTVPRALLESPYEILGIPIGVTPHDYRAVNTDTLRQAYKQAARANHPDINRDRPEAGEKFAAVSVAFETLSEPAKRATYDLVLDWSGWIRIPRDVHGFNTFYDRLSSKYEGRQEAAVQKLINVQTAGMAAALLVLAFVYKWRLVTVGPTADGIPLHAVPDDDKPPHVPALNEAPPDAGTSAPPDAGISDLPDAGTSERPSHLTKDASAAEPTSSLNVSAIAAIDPSASIPCGSPNAPAVAAIDPSAAEPTSHAEPARSLNAEPACSPNVEPTCSPKASAVVPLCGLVAGWTAAILSSANGYSGLGLGLGLGFGLGLGQGQGQGQGQG